MEAQADNLFLLCPNERAKYLGYKKYVDGMHMPPGKANYLVTGYRFEGQIMPRKCGLVKPSYKPEVFKLLGWFYFEAHFGCHS